MRLLVVTQYFWPEAFIINDLVRTLRDQGHTVTVATGKPNYPEGRVFEGYTADGTQHEKFDSTIDVFRVPLRPRGNRGGLNLFRNYLSFVWSGLRWFPGLLRGVRADVILVFAPSPIIAAITALPLKWLKRAHLAIWVQDLWPESLAATGHVRNRALLGIVGWCVRGIYWGADTLLVQSRAFTGPVSRYGSAAKIVYYPNSLSIDAQTGRGEAKLPADAEAAFARDFCVVFAGNIGSVQAIPTLIEAACLLRDTPGVRLVVIGSGSMAEWVRERRRALGLENLLLVDRLPMSMMPSVYRRAGALLVSLKNDPILAQTVPSKVQAYLAAGRPIIAALPGEGARLLTETGAGLTCPPEDAAALAESIRAMAGLPASARDAMGRAALAYFAEHFEMGRQATQLVELLERRTAATGRGDA